MRTPLRGRVGAACLALAGCAGGGAPAAPPSAAALEAMGADARVCYRFAENDAFRALGLPWGVALRGGPLPGMVDPGDRRDAATLGPDGTVSSVPFGAWRALPGDSVQVDPALTGSLQLRLAVDAEGLHGLGRAVGDVAGPWAAERDAPVGDVRAEPVACPPAP